MTICSSWGGWVGFHVAPDNCKIRPLAHQWSDLIHLRPKPDPRSFAGVDHDFLAVIQRLETGRLYVGSFRHM